MRMKQWTAFVGLILAGLVLAACGGASPAEETEADRVATRVAEDLAVAATLTAAVPPAGASPAQPAPATATEQAPAPTATPEAATATTAPVQDATDTPPPPPTDTPPPQAPTPTPILIAVLPVDGGGGDVPNIRNNNPVKDGRNVTLPGFAPNEATEPMVFRDRIVYQAEVFDANYGTNDGDGIEDVTFVIFDSNGNLVHDKTENTPGYCVFGGGEPDCWVLNLAEEGYRWPNGEPITTGRHEAEILINPIEGQEVTWFWSFEVEVPQSQVLSAEITAISLQGDRYAVAFETTGFAPQLPGQHLHFFFDTVPPGEAGLPGQGPWRIYGGQSPFTEYGPADRPGDATQMCVLVANPDHSVQADTGNCWDLP